MTEARGLLVWDDRFTDYDFGSDHPFTELSRQSLVRLLEATLPADHPIERALAGPGCDPRVPRDLS